MRQVQGSAGLLSHWRPLVPNTQIRTTTELALVCQFLTLHPPHAPLGCASGERSNERPSQVSGGGEPTAALLSRTSISPLPASAPAANVQDLPDAETPSMIRAGRLLAGSDRCDPGDMECQIILQQSWASQSDRSWVDHSLYFE